MLRNAAAAREALRTNEAAQERLREWQRSPDNPINSSDVRRRAVVSHAANGHTGLTWHPSKGPRPLTVPQQILLAHLGAGWLPEVTVRTYAILAARRPYWYRLDLARPDLLLAVEVDGASHKGRKTHDRRRDEVLAALGWNILRFSNRRIRINPDGVVAEIEAVIKSLTSRP